jgi:prolyl-tRNA editing enzyme YbaK/EbsC (Cys-tRNA(Pro) deacylase)
MVDLPIVAIGGGAHGVNIHLAPADLVAATSAEVVDVTVPDAPTEPGAAATS